MICVSVVSHGQAEIAAGFLRSLSVVAPGLVSQLVYTRNIPEPELAPVELDGIELVVIDNAQPRGFGENHNAAFEHCTRPYFCVVNPDILLSVDPFGALLRCLEDPALGLVAPVVTTPALAVENTARALYTPLELLRQKLSPRNRGTEAHWLAGMFLLFRSEAYRGIGGFDEGYFLYIEDVDICTRLRLAGWRLAQCQTCSVIHDARKQSHRSLKYTSWHIAGMLRYWSSRSFWRYRALLRGQFARGAGHGDAVAGAASPSEDREPPATR